MVAVDGAGWSQPGRLPGEATLMARYMNQIATWNVAIPLAGAVDAELYASLPRQNFIDELVWDKLATLGITPVEPAGDAHVPAAGLSRRHRPLADARRSARVSGRARRRTSASELVDALLERPEYADHWANKWADLLRPNPYRVGIKAVDELRRLDSRRLPQEQAVRPVRPRAGHRPGQHVATTARRRCSATAASRTRSRRWSASCSSASGWNAPSATIIRSKSGARTTSTASPRTSPASATRATGISPPISGGEEIIFAADSGPVEHPLTGKVLQPRPLFGEAPADRRPDDDPREALAAWMTVDRESVLRPGDGQPRLGRPDGPRPGRAGRRPAGHEPAERTARCSTALADDFRAARLRPEEADPHDHDLARLRAVARCRTSGTSPTRATTRGTTASGCGPRCCSTR